MLYKTWNINESHEMKFINNQTMITIDLIQKKKKIEQIMHAAVTISCCQTTCLFHFLSFQNFKNYFLNFFHKIF